MNSMENFFNWVTKPVSNDDVELWFGINNIIPEKAELFYDFCLSLFTLMSKTYLGDETTSNETRILITEEDKKRTTMYSEESDRQTVKSKFENYEKFLQSLKTHVEFQRLTSSENLERAVQLSNRTNQFNLCPQRYSIADISKLVEDMKYEFFMARVFDRFGDLGKVALIGLRVEKEKSTIEINEFVLSCRAFGRDIAEIFLATVMNHFKSEGFIKAKEIGRAHV